MSWSRPDILTPNLCLESDTEKISEGSVWAIQCFQSFAMGSPFLQNDGGLDRCHPYSLSRLSFRKSHRGRWPGTMGPGPLFSHSVAAGGVKGQLSQKPRRILLGGDPWDLSLKLRHHGQGSQGCPTAALGLECICVFIRWCYHKRPLCVNIKASYLLLPYTHDTKLPIGGELFFFLS